MNFFKRLLKAVVIVLILAVFALAIWQNRVWLAEHGRPIWAQVKAWASKGTWNETPSQQKGTTLAQDAEKPESVQSSVFIEVPSTATTADEESIAQEGQDAPAAQAPIESKNDFSDQDQTSLAANDETIADDPEIIPEHGTAESLTTHEPASSNAIESESEETESGISTIATVRQLVWAGKLDQAREMLHQNIEKEPENPALLWELLQLERYSQHMHQAARIQWRLQLLTLKHQQEQQLRMLKQWQQQLGQQQTHLNAQIAQMEQELKQTLEELRQPLEKQP